ncbi:MAG: RecQ family zinc-binding domain-containing protein, partial [Prevotella sp.]|nr:RecQ family zinc-binding domain-containing protein [Prevotella sp.]
VDGELMVIPPSVYEERKEQFTKRINAMIEYATNDNVCRSRQLLRYFGETDTEDCGGCDVCLAHGQRPAGKHNQESARQAVLSLLEDRKKHPITELRSLALPQALLDQALQYLINEEEIHIDGSSLYL